jgi:hypothetical protein
MEVDAKMKRMRSEGPRGCDRGYRSLKKHLPCLSGIFYLVGTAITEPDTAGPYFKTELPVAKADLLAFGSDNR